MKKTVLLLIFFLTSFNLFSQANKKIDSAYVHYVQNTREIPYLHLNKTSFIKGEEIWFKAYIQEQNSQKLHPTTTNLYISIFNKTGKLKDQQLVNIKEGTGNGSIYLDSTYTQKEYYIKASTRWMKNFKEDNAYYQKISLASSKNNVKTIITTEKDSFEFKLLPEGGHLVANIINNVGVIIKKANNKGVKIKKGIIRDQNNNIIRQFTTNELGMNNVRLLIKKNKVYTFYATLFNGSEIKATTNLPSLQGVT